MNRLGLPVTHDFPEGFLAEECRCGYVVSSRLKRIWAIELDLLQTFMDVCSRHNIQFHVSFGALLGAIRHSGFIPWDDDIDVWMTREEFRKLEGVAQEFKHPYFLQTLRTEPNYFINPARLRNADTTAVIEGVDGTCVNAGMYIDIDVLDGACTNRFLWPIQEFLYKVSANCLAWRGRNKIKGAWVKCAIGLLLRPLLRFFSWELFVSFYEKSRGAFGRRDLFDPHSMSSRKKGYRLQMSELSKTIYVPFEHLNVPVPEEYDSVLRKIYGDYMKYPPVEERGMWHEGVVHFEPDVPYVEYLKNHSSCK